MAKKEKARKAVAYNVPEEWIDLKEGSEKFSVKVPVYEDGKPTGKNCRVLGVPVMRTIGDNDVYSCKPAYGFKYNGHTRVRDESKPLEGLVNIDFGYPTKADGTPYILYAKMDGEKESIRMPVADVVTMINDALDGMQHEDKKRRLFGNETYERMNASATKEIPAAVEAPAEPEDEGLEEEDGFVAPEPE